MGSRLRRQRSQEGCWEARQGVSPGPFSAQGQAPPPLGARRPVPSPKSASHRGTLAVLAQTPRARETLTHAGTGQRLEPSVPSRTQARGGRRPVPLQPAPGSFHRRQVLAFPPRPSAPGPRTCPSLNKGPGRVRREPSGQTPAPPRSPRRGASPPPAPAAAPPPARSPAAGAAVRAGRRARRPHAPASAAERAAALRPPAAQHRPRSSSPAPHLPPSLPPGAQRPPPSLPRAPPLPCPARAGPDPHIPVPPLRLGLEGPFRASAGAPTGRMIWLQGSTRSQAKRISGVLTALLPQEHQLEFSQWVPKISPCGHGAGSRAVQEEVEEKRRSREGGGGGRGEAAGGAGAGGGRAGCARP